MEETPKATVQSSSVRDLEELDRIESDILQILQLAKDTTDVLQLVPNVNQHKLCELSSTYFELVSSVNERLASFSKVMNPKIIPLGGNYGLKKQLEIAQLSAAVQGSCP